MITDQLLQWTRARGYRAAWAPASVLDDVRQDLERRGAAGEFDATFARDQLSSFDFALPPSVRWTVLVVAMPRPAHRVAFTVGGRRIDAILPPTYVRYRGTFADVWHDLQTDPLRGARVEVVNVPLKPLAARIGLARYGRNNLCYVAPFGSYMQLVGVVTDAELPIRADWRSYEPALLDDCEDCSICEAVCPTGAIGDDRVLLHAERCLTFLNENAAPLPSWVSPSAHHALIGCVQCQRHCPANAALSVEDTGVLFTEQETAALLDGVRLGAETSDGRRKLDALALTDEHLIGRNLLALLSASGEVRHG